MKPRLLELLVCPACKGDLTARTDQVTDGEIVTGALACAACRASYPVTAGIPRFVGHDAYAESFGDEWHRFRTVQIDSLNGTTQSEDGFRLKTGLSPDDVRGRLVLDAGVGAGRYAEVMARWGAEVVGVDLTRAVDAAALNLRAYSSAHLVQADIFALPSVTVGKKVLRTHNRLLASFPGADGMKTGFICASGFNMVATAKRDGKRLIAVVFGAYSSGQRNQDTITRFKTKPPELHVIVSTEAGSEGVNLQAANVLVNYDLPWNPMVVEQRIGRIQRLASEHASVCIFNVILKGTFEEYIVGRLMQKLQMASHAIGDVESLLEAAGMDDDEDGKASFAEKIRALVISSLKGKDVERASRLAEESISEAKAELEREEKNINSLLSGMDGGSGPKCPDLPPPHRSMDEKTFIRAAVQALGGELKEKPDGLLEMHLDAKRELVRFEVDEVPGSPASILYAAGAPAPTPAAPRQWPRPSPARSAPRRRWRSCPRWR